MKYIRNIQNFKKLSKINEYYVFENETKWGDSLLGRLIHSVFRKARQYYKTAKIEGLIQEVDDNISKMVEYNKDRKREIEELAQKQALRSISDIVNSDKEENIKLIFNELVAESNEEDGLVPECISMLKKSKINGKDDIVKKLEGFKKWIVENRPGDEVKMKEKEEKNENLQDKKLKDMGKNVIKIQIPIDTPFEKILRNDYSGIKGEILLSNFGKMIQDKNFIEYLQKRDPDLFKNINSIYKKNTQTTQQKPEQWPSKRSPEGQQHVENPLVKKQNASYEFFMEAVALENNIGNLIKNYGKSISSALVNYLRERPQSTQILKNILLSGVSDIKTKETIDFKVEQNDTLKSICYALSTIKNDELKKLHSENPKETTGQLYVKILRNKINSHKGEIILDDKIKNLYDKWYKQIVNINGITESIKKEEIKKEEIKKESLFIKYFDFLKIYEADETVDFAEKTEKKKDEIKSPMSKLKGEWEKLFTKEDISKVSATGKEMEELNNKLEKEEIKGDIKLNDKNDPILQIINTFGRAYEMYTSPTIPSGRTEGRVSDQTYRQWEYAGERGSAGTPDKPGYGPWIEKAVFKKWDDGIMNILKKRNDFLSKANLLIKAKEGEPRKVNGKIIAEFINNLLTVKKGDFDSERNKLISKYFGVASSDYEAEIEKTVLRDKSPSIKEIEKGVALWKEPVEFPKLNLLKHSFAKADIDEIDETGTNKRIVFIYFFDCSATEDGIWIKFQKNGHDIVDKYLKNYIKENNLKIDYTDMPNKESATYFARIERKSYDVFKSGSGEVEISYMDAKTNTKNVTKSKFKIKNFDLLLKYESEDNEKTISKIIYVPDGQVAERPKTDSNDLKGDKLKEYKNLLNKKEENKEK